MKFFDKNSKGSILNRISKDTFMVDDDLGGTFHCFYELVCNILGLSLGIILNLSGGILLVFLFCLYFIFYFNK